VSASRNRSDGGRDPRTVVITGASAGVGRATARLFAERGANVGLIARGREGLEGVSREVEGRGASAVPVAADVADPDRVETAAETVEAELGPIDVWVNNAMVTVLAPLDEMDPEEFRRVTETTYLGTVHGTMAALRRMRPRDRGAIVQVGSALAYRGIPLQSAYCGAKHAIEGFSESVRAELLHDGSGVHLTMVQLPALNTPQFDWCRTRLPNRPQPVPPIYQPEVAARAIAWAASHRRRELMVGGPTLKVVLGNKLAAGLGDRYLARTGYDSQQTDEPLTEDREDNLFEPVDRDVGAHGRFDDEARDDSIQLRASTKRAPLAGAIAGIAAAAAAIRRR
jgi:NAD(P)-dependent dehydrogenase (short-subunit alcohol dehydrogenase family)